MGESEQFVVPTPELAPAYRSTEAVYSPRFDVELCRLIEWENSTLGSLLVPVHMAQAEGSPHRRAFAILEPRWANNARDVSCIPCGEYRMVPIECPRHGATWRIVGGTVGVHPDSKRTNVELHSGNRRKDTKGCPLPGLAFVRDREEMAVSSSRAAMDALRLILPRDRELDLRIYNAGESKWGPAFRGNVLTMGIG